MKSMKIGRVGVLLSLIVLILAVPGSARAAKISEKKATVYAGQYFVLKMKGIGKKKVIWSSSNNEVAAVNKKGKVTAKKKGKATITAKVGKKKYKCKVTVKHLLKVDKTEITIGREGVINCWLYAADVEIRENVKNASIVTTRFGDWDGDRIPLYITGLKKGETTITVSNSLTNESYTIKVVVKL